MPELPEVETMRRDLHAALRDASIASVRLHHDDILLDGGSPARFAAEIRNGRIDEVERRGKNLIVHVAAGGAAGAAGDAADDAAGAAGGAAGDRAEARGKILQIQVRMTGRFAVAPADDPGGGRLRAAIGFTHVAAEFGLADGRTLIYDDVRRLGGFRLQSRADWERRERELGPEPLGAGFGASDLAAALGTGRGPVKNALLDQRRIAGVGNIYANEALFRARIDPRRACVDLDSADLGRLHRALRGVLREALKDEGTSLRDYRAVDGRTGGFQERLRVYGREGLPCPRCGAPVERIVQAGRSSFLCGICQT